MKKIGKQKPFACMECGKQLTYGEAKAAAFRGCPKCGGSDIDAAVVISSPAFAGEVPSPFSAFVAKGA